MARAIRFGILRVRTLEESDQGRIRPREDQTKLFALLKPEENVAVRLTSGFLLEPEQRPSAILVHHPGARYFVV